MYGKHFAQMYSGSMVGAGPAVFAVFGYVIANANLEGMIEINQKILATTIGCPESEIAEALEYLQRPDPDSRTPAEDGRRLIKEGAFTFRVVNYVKYRDIQREKDRRAYMREYMREYRKQKVNSKPNVSNVSPQVEVEVEADKNTARSARSCAYSKEFESFWKAYPRKVAKAKAFRAWKTHRGAMPDLAELLPVLDAQKKSGEWLKESGSFIPHPATWINGHRWLDELNAKNNGSKYDKSKGF